MHGPRLPRRIADSVKRCFCLDGDSRLPDPWRVAARGEPGPAARPAPALLSPPGSRHPSAALTTAGHSLGRRTRAWQEAPAFLPGPRHRQALQQRCPLTLSRTLRVSVPRAPLCSGRSCSQGAATTVRGGPVGGHGRRAGLWPEESDGSTGLGRL